MRFYKILFSFPLLFLIACNHDPKPENLIGQEQFTSLLVDIHLSDGYLSAKSQVPDTLSYRGNGLYAAVFKRHQVDSAAFRKSYQYYSVHLEQMNEIYKTVLERVTAKNDSITKKLAAEEMQRSRRNADSVKRASKLDSARQAAKQDSIKKIPAKNSIAKPIANHK